METRQEQIEKLAAGKVMSTVETCLCCCSNCKRETIERLRSDIAGLVEKAIKEQEGSE